MDSCRERLSRLRWGGVTLVDVIPLDHPRTATAEGDYEPVGGTMHAHSFVYPQLELPTSSHYSSYFRLSRSEDGT